MKNSKIKVTKTVNVEYNINDLRYGSIEEAISDMKWRKDRNIKTIKAHEKSIKSLRDGIIECDLTLKELRILKKKERVL